MRPDITPLSFAAQTVHCVPHAAARPIRILVAAFPARDALPRGPRTRRHPIVHVRLRRRMGLTSTAHTCTPPRHPPLAIAKPRGVQARVGSLCADPETPRRSTAVSPVTARPPCLVPSNLMYAGSDIDAPARSVPLVRTVVCRCADAFTRTAQCVYVDRCMCTPTLDATATEAASCALRGRRCGEGLMQARSGEHGCAPRPKGGRCASASED
ncbi:hypothetical protein B0H13DRAFT_2414224 [Mycena leptocephala]|nr:hypothetical protein B0H13DRAFT_2414224 [Mycena leptocephala]